MTTVAFAPLTTAEQIFHDLIWEPMIKIGMNWIEGAVPFLDLPVIKNIDEELLGILTDYIFKQLVLTVDVTAIRLVNEAHQAAFNSASLQLELIAEQSGISSEAFIKARNDAKAALSKFTNIAST